MSSKHFDNAVYAQVVAGCLPAKEGEDFEAHIQSGCESCKAALHWYQSLSRLLQKCPTYEPPVSSDRPRTNGIPRGIGEKADLITVLASRVFDTAFEPLSAGLRQSQSTVRQVLYQAGDLELDLNIDWFDEEHEQRIIGQLIPQDGSGLPHLSPLKVILRNEGRVVQSTYSNELGEFLLRLGKPGSYDLEILLPDSRRILIAGVPGTDDDGRIVRF